MLRYNTDLSTGFEGQQVIQENQIWNFCLAFTEVLRKKDFNDVILTQMGYPVVATDMTGQEAGPARADHYDIWCLLEWTITPLICVKLVLCSLSSILQGAYICI